MPDRDFGTTTPHPPITDRMVWVLAGLLFVFGSWLIGQGAWIHIKAMTAQWLLQQAWHETLTSQKPVKPWPWADTWPMGRLIVPRLSINQIVLANASGQSLAFGPGKVRNENFLDKKFESLTLSGHRDTHFSFVQNLQLGDVITMQTVQDEWRSFVVINTEIIDSRTEHLPQNQERADLRLITCYPFDAVLPGGPLRYVVTAEPEVPGVLFQTEASASAAGGSRGRGIIMEGG